MKKRIPLLAGIALFAAAGCSASAGPDQTGVEYDAGPMSSTQFANCVAPGTREYRGPGDEILLYPAGQRTYRFGTKPGVEAKPISVVSHDQTPMTVTGLVTFSLKTDCETLKVFHERFGRKFDASFDEDGTNEGGGWNRLLDTYLGEPLDRALDNAAKNYDWKDLYTDQTKRQQMEQQVGREVLTFIRQQTGGEFFCSPTYSGVGPCGAPSITLQQPEPPERVREALADAQVAIEQAAAQKERNKQIDLEAEGLKRLTAILGADAAVLYQAIKQGRVKIVPVPAGGRVNVSGN